MMPTAQIIILNGTSSAGKSTIAKALQNILDQPYLHIGIDSYIFAMPRRYLNLPLWSEIQEYIYTGDEITGIKFGNLGHALFAAMHESVAGLARAGFGVIVDHVLLDDALLQNCRETLAGLPVWFVGVCCPLSVLEQRERERKDRTLGQARAQFNTVHAGKRYDIEVDTSVSTAEECAALVKARMGRGTPPDAFHHPPAL
jgi:chloramphenicol 3-O phosphotransferase